MKFLKVFFGGLLLYILLFAGGSQFAGCKKTIEHDTVITIKHDTIIKKDTVTIIDSTAGIREGMIAYFNFNNGSLKDSSGKGNHIVFSNAVATTDRFGKANNAYLFDGTSSYMRVSNSSSLNPANMSMVAIVKPNGFYQGLNHANQIFMKGPTDPSQGVYSFRIGPSTGDCCTPGAADTTKEVVNGYYGDGSSLGVSSFGSYIHTNRWYTLIVTYDGYQARVYVDGQLINVSNGSPVFTANTNDLYIGKTENPTYPYLFNGVIDEIRIYNKALCDNDIKQISYLKQ
jgi:Concanavalin A-like lectin/glucanases superfamily